MKMSDLDAAVEKIRSARERLGNYAGLDTAALDEALGPQVHTDQPEARIAPWFSFVGWGGLIIEQQVDIEGFRPLNEESTPLIESILLDPPQYYETQDKDSWLAYYIGSSADSGCSELQETNDDVKEQKDNKEIGIIRFPRKDELWPLNQIIYGAPGTGKTYVTAEYAVAIVEKRKIDIASKSEIERKELMSKYAQYVKSGQITFTTFHQSYGYEEFIQGIRPGVKAGDVNFVTADGVFKKIADRALPDLVNNYVIIIDEINRGNISRVFGELITLIEDDKRYGELNQLSITLPLGESFTVPNNLYIIGTMNSADKSISLIDTALRRRFAFVEMIPNEALVEDDTLKSVLYALNIYLRKELHSADLLIGHSYFIGRKADELANIMNRYIIPLLYEYFYDDESKVKKALECLNGTNCSIENKLCGRIRVLKKV
jgi:5-methylcytosine-specific restriction protein B